MTGVWWTRSLRTVCLHRPPAGRHRCADAAPRTRTLRLGAALTWGEGPFPPFWRTEGSSRRAYPLRTDCPRCLPPRGASSSLLSGPDRRLSPGLIRDSSKAQAPRRAAGGGRGCVACVASSCVASEEELARKRTGLRAPPAGSLTTWSPCESRRRGQRCRPCSEAAPKAAHSSRDRDGRPRDCGQRAGARSSV